MPSQAATLLNTAMSSLLGVSGDTMTFRSPLTVSALVEREQAFARPIPASWIEILQSGVASVPVPGEQFIDSTNSTQFTVLFVKKINGWYRCECYVLDDVPVETVVIGGTSYSGHAFQSTEGTDLELGGLTPENFTRILLDRADVSAIPTEGATVTFRGVSTYRVARVQRDQPGAPIIVDIRDEAGRGHS
jgi:hypothetical protein